MHDLPPHVAYQTRTRKKGATDGLALGALNATQRKRCLSAGRQQQALSKKTWKSVEFWLDERERELVFKFQSPMTVMSGRERESLFLTSLQSCMTVISGREREFVFNFQSTMTVISGRER